MNIIDDRIDILSKGTMAMTATCARCHDHKFDPIPTQDYYGLHGVFNSSIEPKEEPLLETPKETSAYQSFRREYAGRTTALKNYRDELARHYKADMVIGKSGVYMLAVAEYRSHTHDISRYTFLEKRGLNPIIGNIWDNNMKFWDKRHNPIFAPWIAFARLSDDEFITQSKELSAKIYASREKGKPINPVIARMFASAPTSLTQVATRYQSVFSDTEERWQEVLATFEAGKVSNTNSSAEPKGLPDVTQEQVRQMMYGNSSPMFLDEQRLNTLINREGKLRNRLLQLERAVNDLVVNDPGSPAPGTTVLEDADKPKDSNIFIKGNPGNRGPVAPRHFFTILSAGNPRRFPRAAVDTTGTLCPGHREQR